MQAGTSSRRRGSRWPSSRLLRTLPELCCCLVGICHQLRHVSGEQLAVLHHHTPIDAAEVDPACAGRTQQQCSYWVSTCSSTEAARVNMDCLLYCLRCAALPELLQMSACHTLQFSRPQLIVPAARKGCNNSLAALGCTQKAGALDACMQSLLAVDAEESRQPT